MAIQSIFWDNDGVLVDTERYYLQASQEALGRAGINLTEEQFVRTSLTEGRSVFELATDRGLAESQVIELKRWRDKRYSQLLASEELLLDGARETLEALCGKLKMAIVTGSRRNHFEIIHRRTGLLPFFDFCLTREDYLRGKPDAEPYLLALQRSGLEARHALVIEDSPRGLSAAKAAGLTCWVIPGRHTDAAMFNTADRVLSSIREVPGLLE